MLLGSAMTRLRVAREKEIGIQLKFGYLIKIITFNYLSKYIIITLVVGVIQVEIN